MAKKKNYYFTQETEDAIIRYNKEEDPIVRDRIYSKDIDYPFDKLAENIIHTFKFYYFDVSPDEVKHEVVSFLVMNMHKFKEGKGKAFSYFSVVAKNYLILNNNANYKRYKTHHDLIVLDSKKNARKAAADKEVNEDNRLFVRLLVKYWEENIYKVFSKEREIAVADAIIELFRRSGTIENFNKKALYILIREMTGIRTQYITKVINIMKKHNVKLINEFQSTGTVGSGYGYRWKTK
jgi:hypothetical protein|tara:strand:- start:84 stop:794 length:711 start_codon:yes stop_codon:yes gene_type:complete